MPTLWVTSPSQEQVEELLRELIVVSRFFHLLSEEKEKKAMAIKKISRIEGKNLTAAGFSEEQKAAKIEGITTMSDIINYEQFSKVDLRVGTIKKVEDVEGADKLLKLEVDLGKEIGKRTILAGIKKYYKKEELKDKQIIVVANLEPRKMKGFESQGMLLAAVNDDESKVILLSPEKKIENGAKVR
jgi:methionyl-tRNA synthetase